MEEKFYTSTEAAEITNCSRRQLQYWREKGVIVPTVNASGKGRNVYYSKADLLALTAMEYLLSMGLNFEVCQQILATLKTRESWLFHESLSEEQMKRFMVLLDTNKHDLQLVDFDSKLALENIYNGFSVVCFWSDRIYQRLQEHLRDYVS